MAIDFIIILPWHMEYVMDYPAYTMATCESLKI